MGIGLSLVQNSWTASRTVEVYSAGLQEGSEFIVRLPVLLSLAKATSITPSEPVKPPAQIWRVLIVDDNADSLIAQLCCCECQAMTCEWHTPVRPLWKRQLISTGLHSAGYWVAGWTAMRLHGGCVSTQLKMCGNCRNRVRQDSDRQLS